MILLVVQNADPLHCVHTSIMCATPLAAWAMAFQYGHGCPSLQLAGSKGMHRDMAQLSSAAGVAHIRGVDRLSYQQLICKDIQGCVVDGGPGGRRCCCLSQSVGQLLLGLGLELDGNAVHAVADVGRGGKTLVLEDVAQMASTLGTGDLHALHAVAEVDVPFHSARNLIEKRRPPTAGVKLLVGREQRCAAASAVVDTVLEMLVIFTGAWWFRALLTQHVVLFLVQNPLPHIIWS